jgi:hypothetical protein
MRSSALSPKGRWVKGGPWVAKTIFSKARHPPHAVAHLVGRHYRHWGSPSCYRDRRRFPCCDRALLLLQATAMDVTPLEKLRRILTDANARGHTAEPRLTATSTFLGRGLGASSCPRSTSPPPRASHDRAVGRKTESCARSECVVIACLASGDSWGPVKARGARTGRPRQALTSDAARGHIIRFSAGGLNTARNVELRRGHAIGRSVHASENPRLCGAKPEPSLITGTTMSELEPHTG